MGTEKSKRHEALETIPEKLEITTRTLCANIIAQPWSFHKVDGKLSEPMLASMGNYYARIIRECKKQFDSTGRFTPQSIAMALNYDSPSLLLQMAMEDADSDVSFAYALFLDVYGQKIAYDIWLNIPSWLTLGKTGDEIAIESERMRRESGAIQFNEASDGKEEFEKALCMALEGKTIHYPVGPHLAALRRMIKCYEQGDYIIVAALSGVGKTFYAIGEVYAAALDGIPSCLINLENTPKNMQKRLWQKHCGEFFQTDLRSTDDITRKRLQAWEDVKRFPIANYNPGRALPSILSAIRQDWHERGIKLAVIDYAQKIYIPGFKGPRNYELDRVSAEFRELALELEIPVIVLAQMKQEVSKYPDKRGGMYDIKDCAGFAQDATMVINLHRPEYFNIKECDGIQYPEGYADAAVVKGRETGTALAECRFDPVQGFHDIPTETFTQFPVQPPKMERPNMEEDIPF